MNKPWMPDKIPRLPRDLKELEQQIRGGYARGKADGIEDTINLSIGAMLYILKDKHDYTPEQIQELGEEFAYAIDSINQGYMSMTNVWKLLREDGVKPHIRR